MTQNPFSFEEYKEIYSKVPRVTVEVVIKSSKGVLLTLRKLGPYKGTWHLPGGTLRFRERLIKAAARVAKQELGVNVKVLKFLGYIEYLQKDNNEVFDHPIGFAFLCKVKSDKFILDSQASKAEYFLKSPDKIVEDQKKFLEKNKLL